MHQKQIVINRKYFDPNKLKQPASLSIWFGGFNNFVIFAGNSRPLTFAALRIISSTSATRPLHKSHRGDSGIINLYTTLIN